MRNGWALIAAALSILPVDDARSAARTCKQVTSCEDAVILWCSGYRCADGDHDGIPCENVRHSLEDVRTIREEIGC